MPLPRLTDAPPRPGMLVAPGAMNKQFTFFKPGNALAGTQPEAQSPTTPGALYAIAGNELDRAQQISTKITHLAVIPYQLGITGSMTFQYLDGGNTRTFQIEGIADSNEQRWQLKIYCYEINQNAGGGN